MKSLPPPSSIRFKIVMSQIILAKVLKPNIESRGQVIAYLFS
jgi:hypothetical protein